MSAKHRLIEPRGELGKLQAAEREPTTSMRAHGRAFAPVLASVFMMELALVLHQITVIHH